MLPSLSSLVLQHNDVACSPAGKQRPDQLHGHGLVALRTLIPLQAIGSKNLRPEGIARSFGHF
jgi:hypothetical protein